MERAETPEALKLARRAMGHGTVVLVPTMGALHEGHLALIQKAKTLGDKVVVSLYVNPMQFGPNEDFGRYPRTLDADLALCESTGVDLVFLPQTETVYPNGVEAMTRVVPPPSLADRLCGASRPGHFTGVATVVLKLFQLVRPHVAVFGEKDAQQLTIIRRMASDLALPVDIVGVETVREPDGVAKSSRNRMLPDDASRRQARLLSRLLAAVQSAYEAGETDVAALRDAALTQVDSPDLYPDFTLEYLEVCDPVTLAPVVTATAEARVFVAARVGAVRLIDNASLGVPLRLPPPTALYR